MAEVNFASLQTGCDGEIDWRDVRIWDRRVKLIKAYQVQGLVAERTTKDALFPCLKVSSMSERGRLSGIGCEACEGLIKSSLNRHYCYSRIEGIKGVEVCCNAAQRKERLHALRRRCILVWLQ